MSIYGAVIVKGMVYNVLGNRYSVYLPTISILIFVALEALFYSNYILPGLKSLSFFFRHKHKANSKRIVINIASLKNKKLDSRITQSSKRLNSRINRKI